MAIIELPGKFEGVSQFLCVFSERPLKNSWLTSQERNSFRRIDIFPVCLEYGRNDFDVIKFSAILQLEHFLNRTVSEYFQIRVKRIVLTPCTCFYCQWFPNCTIIYRASFLLSLNSKFQETNRFSVYIFLQMTHYVNFVLKNFKLYISLYSNRQFY